MASLLCTLLFAVPSTAEPGRLTTLRLHQMPAQTGSTTLEARGLERIPPASWIMGCAAGGALVAHALYQNLSERRRARLSDCADDCTEHRIDYYKESRERADVALRLSVLAAASALWLVYNDPEEALVRMSQGQRPTKRHGFKVKVKPARRGVWASVVAHF